MSLFPGNSNIPVFAAILPSAEIGPVGPSGPPGNPGITGETIPGNIGPTGSGISSIVYFNNGISFIKSDGSVTYLSFPGITGVSYENEIPNSIIIAKGLTYGSSSGLSILYSFVDPFEQINKIAIQPQGKPNFNELQDETTLKFRVLTASGNALDDLNSDASYVYLIGKTFSDRNVGNTGEILYKLNSLIYAVNGSYYDYDQSLLSVPLAADRYSIHNNQNIQTPTYLFSNQNILGETGPTGFGFFNNKYGSFSVNNNSYQFNQDVVKSETTLFVGTTGSDNLTFKFYGITFDRGSSYIPQSVTSTNFGSCCFCQENTTEIDCLDYVSNNYCNAVGGSFNTVSCLNRISSGDCYAEGACCVNGKCLNTSSEKCLQYKGIFFPNQVCYSGFVCPTNLCPVDVNVTGRCCVRGYCFDLKKSECDAIPNALFTAGVACVDRTDPACCAGLSGACCIKNGASYTCTTKTPEQCTISNGIFHGVGSSCTNVECCGLNYIDEYYNSTNETCIVNNEFSTCVPIGTKIAGGYFAGIVGMPSPCSSNDAPHTAYGQPLICRVLPRGEVNGPNGYLWPWKQCKGRNNVKFFDSSSLATSNGKFHNIEYFVRTKSSQSYNLNYSNNKLKNCFVKYGTPYIQQTYSNEIENINGTFTYELLWPNNIQYEGASGYNPANGSYAYPIGADFDLNYIIPEKISDESVASRLYKELASIYYGNNDIHILWALIVAPDDAFESQQLLWGMQEGRARLNDYNLEPITTFAVDGLLATRLFDETSKTKPRLWFRGNGSTDLKAYDRFCFYNTNTITARSAWNSSVIESAIETNINLFAEKYAEMWDANNANNTCTKQISILNQNQYRGYDDWYIPSIVELNYIYNHINDINSEILLNGDQIIDTANTPQNTLYWSSTSVCNLLSWNNQNHLDYASYRLQQESGFGFVQENNSKYRFTVNDFVGLNDKTAYELSLNTCAGSNMLAQSFSNTSNGTIISQKRLLQRAKLRPVRRIPLVVGCSNQNIEPLINNNTYFDTCNSCPGSCL